MLFRHNGLLLWLSLAFLVYATQVFSYVGWDPVWGGRLSYPIYLAVAVAAWLDRPQWAALTRIDMIVVLLTVCPWLCLAGKCLVYGESPLDERYYLPATSAFLFYFIFKAHRVRLDDLVRLLEVVAWTILVLQVVQQAVPGWARFGAYSDELSVAAAGDAAEVRGGLYRYRIDTYFAVLFCLYYRWNRLLAVPSWRNVLGVVPFALSVGLYLTRQIWASALLTLMLSPLLFYRGRAARLLSLGLGGVAVMAVVALASVYLDDMVELTRAELTTDNLRLLCLVWYWQWTAASPVSFLLGSGHLTDLEQWEQTYKFFTTDIGLFGEWFLYGLLWIGLYACTLWLMLVRWRRRLPLCLKLFYIGTALNSALIFPYRTADEYFVWAVALYMADTYVRRYSPQGNASVSAIPTAG